MSYKKADATVSVHSQDEIDLARQGYRTEFLREFGNLSTFSFAFSIMGLVASIAITFSTPLELGGPASVVWCWALGAFFSIFLATAIAELISAYPTNGALYTASAKLVPPQYRAPVGFVIGWMNVIGNIAGAASTEFGLAQMIWAGVSAGKGGYTPSAGQVVGLYIGLLFFHGIGNSMKTKQLAFVAQFFVFINLGTTLAVIISLLAKTPHDEIHSASYTFTTLENGSGWGSNGFAFLLGLLSVQWTMTGYDATAHISEEVKRAAIAAPVAVFMAVISTAVFGFILNVVVVLCSGPLADLPGPSGNAFLGILILRLGLTGGLVVWAFICLVAVFTLQAGLQANARSVFALSRDRGIPDWGFFSKLNKITKTPLTCVWLVVFLSIVLGCLDFASVIAIEAIFSLATVALDLSYAMPIFFRLIFEGVDGVEFRPGPFHLGNSIWAKMVRWIAVVWVSFEVVILSFPEVYPVTADTMNYAGVITLGVMLLAGAWYLISGHRHYKGPLANLPPEELAKFRQIESDASFRDEEEKVSF